MNPSSDRITKPAPSPVRKPYQQSLPHRPGGHVLIARSRRPRHQRHHPGPHRPL